MPRLRFFFRTGPRLGPVLLLCVVLIAQTVGCSTSRHHVRDSILGIRIGSDLEEADEKLSRLSLAPTKQAPDEDEREEGKKAAWTLRGTDFKAVALQTDQAGKVVWVTGFVRPGHEIPFATLGDLSSAIRSTGSEAIWNVASGKGGYRLVAKGSNGRAQVIYLLSLGTE
ncbi:MAG: hypothetical protein NVSMB68_07830 [Thermoanaerobaculia bacterium]